MISFIIGESEMLVILTEVAGSRSAAPWVWSRFLCSALPFFDHVNRARKI